MPARVVVFNIIISLWILATDVSHRVSQQASLVFAIKLGPTWCLVVAISHRETEQLKR